MDETVPAFTTMQEVAGHLPSECIFLFAHQIASDKWIGEFNVPSYMRWTVTTDQRPAYAYHRRLLQVLQSRHRGARWVLKAPSHLHNLPLLFDSYPDARVVVTHRDPLKVLGSLANLMASLQWMRSNQVSYERIVRSMSFGFAYQLEKLSQERDQGTIPNGQILDVRYADLVRSPIETVRSIYRSFDLALSPEAESRIRAHLEGRPRERRGLHDYSFADTGLDLAIERERHASYQQRYDVPSEVR
jgi:hypothetical protein